MAQVKARRWRVDSIRPPGTPRPAAGISPSITIRGHPRPRLSASGAADQALSCAALSRTAARTVPGSFPPSRSLGRRPFRRRSFAVRSKGVFAG